MGDALGERRSKIANGKSGGGSCQCPGGGQVRKSWAIKIPQKSISFELLKSLNEPIFTSADVKILSFGEHSQLCTLLMNKALHTILASI